MKRYLLDTSLVAAFLHGRKHIIELINPWVRKQEVGTSILVYGEVIEYLKGLADYSRYQARLLSGASAKFMPSLGDERCLACGEADGACGVPTQRDACAHSNRPSPSVPSPQLAPNSQSAFL
jgi:hypothetical protein